MSEVRTASRTCPAARQGRRRATTAAVALAVGLLATGCSRRTQLPDIVLVSIDTVRADHLSLYGYDRPTSPQLDRFAQRDCRIYDGSVSSSTWTLPSHGSMFTGLLPGEHGLTHVERRLSKRSRTLAQRLQDAGYATSAVTDGGFLAPLWGLERGFGRYSATTGEAWEKKDARVIFDSARTELARLSAGSTPFFLFVHSYEAHQPYDNREGFADPFLDPAYDGPLQATAGSTSRTDQAPDPADRRRMIDLYDGEIRRLDHFLGEFLAELRRARRDRPTWIVVTSDHGEAFGEHGTWEHGLGRVEDENVGVPLLLCGPGLSQAGHWAVPTSTLDVAPTLLALASLDVPDEMLGRPLTTLPRDAHRWTVSHGYNSHPDLDEEWLRLGDGAHRLVVDVRRGRIDEPGAASRTALERALIVLGRGRGADRIVVVPAGVEKLPRVGALGAAVFATLDGSNWQVRALDGELREIDLDPSSDSLLLLRSEAVRTVDLPARLLLREGRLELVARRDDPTVPDDHPFDDDGSLAWLLLRGGTTPGRARAATSEESRRELRALGYL